VSLLRTIFLYFSECDSRGCITLLPGAVDPDFLVNMTDEEERDMARGWAVLIDPYQGATGVAAFDRTWAREQQEQAGGLDNRCPITRWKPTRQQAFGALQSRLEQLHRTSRGPTVLVVQSSVARPELSKLLPGISELPQVWVPRNEKDNAYPAFSWHEHVSKVVFSRRRQHVRWLSAQVDSARCARVPLGNLSPDLPILTVDLAFARRLQQQQHLLWLSETTRPDLGVLDQAEDTLYEESLHYPQVNVPGCYRKVCVELQIRGLAINTILQSHHINDMEFGGASSSMGGSSLRAGAGSGGGGGGGASAGTVDSDMRYERSYDDREAPWEPFRILKSLVHAWTMQLAQVNGAGGELTAVDALRDEVLDHIYRWVG
jgi:DNA polymerase epsilon subunit 1